MHLPNLELGTPLALSCVFAVKSWTHAGERTAVVGDGDWLTMPFKFSSRAPTLTPTMTKKADRPVSRRPSHH